MKKSDNRREEMSKMYEKTTIGFFHIDGQNVFGKIHILITWTDDCFTDIYICNYDLFHVNKHKISAPCQG